MTRIAVKATTAFFSAAETGKSSAMESASLGYFAALLTHLTASSALYVFLFEGFNPGLIYLQINESLI